MAKSKNKRIVEIILIVLIILSVGLVVAEMTSNLYNEIATQEQNTTTIQETVEPTPVPTLTAEEREDLFSAPVGEDGND